MQKVLQRDCENGDDGVFAWMLLDKDKLNKKGEEAPPPVSKLGASQARIAGTWNLIRRGRSRLIACRFECRYEGN